MVVEFPRRIIKRREKGEAGDSSATEATQGAPGEPGAAEQAPAQATAMAAQAAPTGESEAPGAHSCPHCGSPMAPEQDWCTQCGERSSGNTKARAGWYSAGVVTAASAILASGAAAAGVAALSQGSAKESPHAPIVAQSPPTTSAAPTTPVAPVSPGPPETLKAHSQVPPAAQTVRTTHSTSSSTAAAQGGTATGTGTPATGTGTPATSTRSSQTSTSTQSAGPEGSELQGLTASAYTLNPSYPKASLEGPENDPSRALEGRESGTAWSVDVKPGTHENLNVGLQIALGGATRVGSVELHTSTPGFLLEVYGTTASTPPTELSAWKRLGLTPSLKASAVIKLGETGKHMRFVLLWIPKVPSKLSRIAIGEIALFPPS